MKSYSVVQKSKTRWEVKSNVTRRKIGDVTIDGDGLFRAVMNDGRIVGLFPQLTHAARAIYENWV